MQAGVGGYSLADLEVYSVAPSLWLRGTRVTIEGGGFVPPDVGYMTATITGDAGGMQVGFKVDLEYKGQGKAGFVIGDALLAQLPLDLPPLDGLITIERVGDRGVSGIASMNFQVTVVSMLSPTIESIAPENAFLGEEMTITGSGFLMQGEGRPAGQSHGAMEGVTILELNGFYRQPGYLGEVEKNGITIPLTVIDRTTAVFMLSPDLFGLGPGTFEGSAEVRNLFSSESGDFLDLSGNRLDGVTIDLDSTKLASMTPMFIRRGQELVFEGKGFLGLDGDLGTVTFIAFTGDRLDQEGTVKYTTTNPMVLVPDFVEGNYKASLVVRTAPGPDGKPSGFGSMRAILNGTFTPHIVFDDLILPGYGLDVTLEVGRQVQVVFVRFMPTFIDGLRAFGMEAVADQVKARAIEVNKADYTGVSIDFRIEKPTDFVDYTTAEVMNKDPNEAGLLGLDNTFGKDEGNLRLNELLGGYNAESAEAGYFPYGGVFVESFLMFSPTLSVGEHDMTAPAFDSLFGDLVPDLGGTAVAPGEYPGGDRDSVISEAIRVLGNLIGDTVSHEVGHVLGLAALAGNFHNQGDNPGWIMDAGAYRPFEERAQLPGGDQRVFAPYNWAYLEEVLPVE